MELEELAKLRGDFELLLFSPEGYLKDAIRKRNLIVTVGKAHVIDQLVNASQASMSHMAVGTGATAPVVGDTALGVELTRKVFDSKTQGTAPNDNQITYTTTYGSGEAVGALTEAGIFNASSGGIMLNRVTFDVKNKQSGDTMVINWTITIP